MAVACTDCGRHYDVTLFEFGRVVRCTCGARVKLEHRFEIELVPGTPRFFADAMLERVARWLRILGFDCAFERGIADADIVRRSAVERRVILTRDHDFRRDWNAMNVFIVSAGSTAEQLSEIVSRFDLSTRFDPFTRCSRCNTRLDDLPREEAVSLVPPRVAECQERFLRCARCARVYWAGSHAERMRAVVDRISRAPEESRALPRTSR